MSYEIALFSLKINDVTPGTTGKKNVEPPEKYFFP
jgi:hypothetical protein